MGCRDHSALAECKDRVLRAHCRSRVPADFSNNATPRASRNHGAGPHRLPSACVAAGSRHWQVSFRAPALLFTRVQTPRERRGSATRGCTREPKHLARAHTESATPTLLSGSAGNTTTEKSHCHLQRGCKSAAARSFPRCSHFPHTLTFGLPQISSPIKKRISNTSVQKNLESGEHEDSAPRNAISKTKLPVCLCMGRTEEAGEVKGGKKKKKSQKAKPRRQFCTDVRTRITHLPRAAASPRCKLHQANLLQALPPPAPSPERLSPAVLQLLPRTEV